PDEAHQNDVSGVGHEPQSAISDDSVESSTPIELIVHVLGTPRIESSERLGRLELNLVTYLACNRRAATESQLIDAVWQGRAIERATLWNRMSKLRAALGHLIPQRDQRSNLVTLAPGVITDLDLLHAVVDETDSQSTADAIDSVLVALRRIDGVP